MSETSDTLKTVSLDARHHALQGRMVAFSGYNLPVHYPLGIVAEHQWTRTQAGLFDVSHMGPSFLTLKAKTGGVEADHRAIAALIEPLICGDIAGLKPGQLRYTLLLNDAGGALDDLMIARPAFSTDAGGLYIVVNAGCKAADWARIEASVGDRATLTRADASALLALQGPAAAAALSALTPGAAALDFMGCGAFDWRGTRLLISRSGYTGEDGFEILVAPEWAGELWDVLLADPRVKPIGLGARDSLRLEAGLPLYGHDLDETISPVEAGLGFAVSKRRRSAGDLPGAARLAREFAGELARVRVGLLVTGAPAREGALIRDSLGQDIGRVTSGGFSPTLGRAIALGFVPPAHAAAGTKLAVVVRGRTQPAEVATLPFVPHRYARKAKP